MAIGDGFSEDYEEKMQGVLKHIIGNDSAAGTVGSDSVVTFVFLTECRSLASNPVFKQRRPADDFDDPDEVVGSVRIGQA